MFFILTRLYRNRRRLAVAVALSMLAGFLMYARHPGTAHGLPVAWTTAALYAGFVGAAGLLVCLFLPAIRFTIEVFALSRLIFAAGVCAFPGVGFAIATDPFLNATVVVSGGIVICMLGYSQLSARIWTVRPGVETIHLTTRIDTVSVWRALLATPPDLAALDYSAKVPGPARCLHDLLGVAPDFGTLDADAAVRAGQAVSADGRRRIMVEDLGDRRRITVTVRRDALPLQARLALWLDDAEARACDVALRQRRYTGSMSPSALMA
jgi:hypothetical protein